MDRRKLKTGLITAGVLLLLTPITLRLLGFGGTQGQPEDAAYFPVQDADTGKWAFIDTQGEALTPFVFDWAGDFRHGRGLAQATIAGEPVMGYIDSAFKADGDWAIAPRFTLADSADQSARGFFDGLAAARDDDGKWGYIDTDGKWAIEPRFVEHPELEGQMPCGDFSDGMAWYCEVEPAMRPVFDDLGKPLRDDEGAMVEEPYLRIRFGYINRRGKEIGATRFAMAQDYGEGLAGVVYTTEPGWAIVDRKGDRVLSSRFEAVDRFNEGVCAVKEGGLWGYIDPEGEWVIEPTFAEARQFVDGLAPARLPDQKWGYINTRGTFVIRARFDDDERPGMFNDPRPFENGVARVLLDGEVRYIDTDGAILWAGGE
mgnify:CR=1 FL=1